MAVSQQTRQSGQGQFPVDNNTYNLVQMLASKLEAIEVYQKYEKDADQKTRGVIQELLQDDRRHAERLLDALRQTLK
jgi:rubrerythrin